MFEISLNYYQASAEVDSSQAVFACILLCVCVCVCVCGQLTILTI